MSRNLVFFSSVLAILSPYTFRSQLVELFKKASENFGLRRIGIFMTLRSWMWSLHFLQPFSSSAMFSTLVSCTHMAVCLGCYSKRNYYEFYFTVACYWHTETQLMFVYPGTF